VSLQHYRYCLPLDGCWYGITDCLQGSGDTLIERKLFEIQRVLPGSIEPSRNLSPMTVNDVVDCGANRSPLDA
jgi:hypothetical protein